MLADELDYVVGVPASGRSWAPAVTAPALPVTSPAAARQCSRSAARHERSGVCAARTTRSTPRDGAGSARGQTTRHRLSRGGDRQLSRALHTVVLHQRQHDPATKADIARRLAEGKSRRDATRLLKCYLARHLYRLLQQEPLMT
jgi:hypothetical protein